MKFLLLMSLSLLLLNAHAEDACDVEPGTSIGIKVIEFKSGNIIHSKMPFRETTADALLEEMINLQDMGVCEEKIIARQCVLKYEKHAKKNFVTLFRGKVRWSTWNLSSKSKAENFIKNLKRVGFCS